MNTELDSTRNLLLWLLYKFDPTFSTPSGNGSTLEANLPEVGSFGVGSDATSMKPSHHHGSKARSKTLAPNPSTFSRVVSFTTHNPMFFVASRKLFSTDSFSQTAQSFNFGEIHAVQERYHSLLKQRLRLEFENNPPLFPWESEISEYPAEVSDIAGATLVAASKTWSTHLSELQISGLLPQPLREALFVQCQALARLPIKQGVRLVKAVENIFPEQGDLLEPIADMVLTPAYRSERAAQAALTQALTAVAGGYDLALPEQQIALSMLAAQEMLGALALSVSPGKPSEVKHWVTPQGALTLSATYTQDQLIIAVSLPTGGQVRLWDGDIEKSAARLQPGALDVVLATPDLDSTYLLEVSLRDENAPLSFAIHLADA